MGRACALHRQDINRWVQSKWLKKRKVWKYIWTWKLGFFWGEIHSTFLGVGSEEEILRWPFLPRAAAGRLSSVWLQGSHELIASIGWGKWNAGSWQSWLLISLPGRGKRNRSVGKLHNCQLPQLLELCRGFCLPQGRISQVVTAAVTEEQVPSVSVTFCATITDIS